MILIRIGAPSGLLRLAPSHPVKVKVVILPTALPEGHSARCCIDIIHGMLTAKTRSIHNDFPQTLSMASAGSPVQCQNSRRSSALPLLDTKTPRG